MTLHPVQWDLISFCTGTAMWTKYTKMLKCGTEFVRKVLISPHDPERQKAVYQRWTLNAEHTKKQGKWKQKCNCWCLLAATCRCLPTSDDELEEMLGPGELISECSDCFKSVSEYFKISVASVQTVGSNSLREPLKSHLLALNYSIEESFSINQFFPETATEVWYNTMIMSQLWAC